MVFPRFFRASRQEQTASELYAAAVLQARRPEFYADFGVADTVDGRFDLIALHAFLLLRRLSAEGARARALSQAVLDIMFADMDQNLREMGVGDLGVGKRVRRMAEAFYGRVAAYDAAMAGPPEALEEALARNLYRGAPGDPARVAAVADYVRRAAAMLAEQGLGDLAAGRVAFGEPVAGEDRRDER